MMSRASQSFQWAIVIQVEATTVICHRAQSARPYGLIICWRKLPRIELTLLIGQYAQRHSGQPPQAFVGRNRAGLAGIRSRIHSIATSITAQSAVVQAPCVVRGAAHTNAAIEDHDTIRLLRSSSKYSGPTRASSNVEGNIRPNADS